MSVRGGAPPGVGLGLRWEFLEELLELPASTLPFVEISPENYLRRGGYYPAALERVRERWPVVTHGLTMSVGGTDPFDDAYFRALRAQLERLGATFHSDHLCWSATPENSLHDLLPLPFTDEAVRHVGRRVREASDRLGLPVALENVSYYAPLGPPAMSELEFLLAVLDESDAPLLLDVNNLHVNSLNHGFDPLAFLARVPLERVVEVHVAGHHVWEDGLVVDTHGAAAPDPVHALLAWVVERAGPLPVVLERDQEIPPLPALLDEVRALGETYDRALARWRARG